MIIKEILKDRPEGKSCGKTNEQVGYVLSHLETVLKNGINGDVVELGCYVGTTSLYIQKMLTMFKSIKKFHVYDSWEGLPAKHEKDGVEEHLFRKGFLTVEKNMFIDLFNKNNVSLPVIHSGWFADIPDEEYPNEICFAFFDGDFYTSIIDSFNKVYHKMQKGGIIVIDDCGNESLPGCKIACIEFLKDKPESLVLDAYGPNGGGGLVIKV